MRQLAYVKHDINKFMFLKEQWVGFRQETQWLKKQVLKKATIRIGEKEGMKTKKYFAKKWEKMLRLLKISLHESIHDQRNIFIPMAG